MLDYTTAQFNRRMLNTPDGMSGEHVGWFCAGGNGDSQCEWTLTHAEAQPFFDAWNARRK